MKSPSPSSFILFLISTLAAFSAGCVAAYSDDSAIWSQGAYEEEAGITYQLTYGIPETDAWSISAYCKAGVGDPAIPVMFALDFSNLEDGSPATVKIAAGELKAEYGGRVSVQGDEFAGILISIGVTDPLWTALPSGREIMFGLPGREALIVPLNGVKAPLKRFLAGCNDTLSKPRAAVQPEALGPFVYVCEDGTYFQASFSNSHSFSVATLSINGQTMNLINTNSGSGARYTNGETEFHTKANEGFLTLPGSNGTLCKSTR